MNQIEHSTTEELDYIIEKAIGQALIVQFAPEAYPEVSKEKISKLIQYAVKSKKEKNPVRIILRLDWCLEDKWPIVFEALSNSVEELSYIEILDFQDSDFPTIMLFKIYVLFEKCADMKNLPTIAIEGSVAHDDYNEIIRALKRKEKGIEFLKKLYLRENRDFEERN